MNKKILAILDGEERYARGLMEYMSGKDNIPFRIHIFTDRGKFIAYQKNEDIECLLVSERIYQDELSELTIPHIIILSETGAKINNTLCHLDKYQSGESIYRQLLNYYTEKSTDNVSFIRTSTRKMKVIGIYTPIGRCLQTTFAITLGQILSKNHKTLYLNFERYSGMSTLLRREFDSDITDLVYYFECAKEKLSLRLDSMVEKVGELDFIPPAKIYQNLNGIKAKQWLELFDEMEKCTEYEYLLLDLTDGMLDLWDVLRGCDLIYTISKGDTMAISKICQYERTLESLSYGDVLKKTRKCALPVFRHLSQKFDELTVGDLAEYLKVNILPEIEGI